MFVMCCMLASTVKYVSFFVLFACWRALTCLQRSWNLLLAQRCTSPCTAHFLPRFAAHVWPRYLIRVLIVRAVAEFIERLTGQYVAQFIKLFLLRRLQLRPWGNGRRREGGRYPGGSPRLPTSEPVTGQQRSFTYQQEAHGDSHRRGVVGQRRSFT